MGYPNKVRLRREFAAVESYQAFAPFDYCMNVCSVHRLSPAALSALANANREFNYTHKIAYDIVNPTCKVYFEIFYHFQRRVIAPKSKFHVAIFITDCYRYEIINSTSRGGNNSSMGLDRLCTFSDHDDYEIEHGMISRSLPFIKEIIAEYVSSKT